MSRNHFMREQFKVLNHIGIPPLTKEGELEGLKVLFPQTPGFKKEERFNELLQLFEDLTCHDQSPKMRSMPNESTFSPLLDNTKYLLEHDDCGPEVKEGFRNLLKMPTQSLSLCYMMDKEKRLLSRGKAKMKFLLKNNYKSCFRKNSVRRKKVHKIGVHEFLHNMFSTEFKRSTSEVVTFKRKKKKGAVGGDYWANVTKKYWFSGPTLRFGAFKADFSTPTSTEHIEKNIVTTLPDSFAWILQYFASYGHVSTAELLQELADVENLILHLNQDYFGYFKGVHTPKRRRGHTWFPFPCHRCDFEFTKQERLDEHIKHAHAPAI